MAKTTGLKTEQEVIHGTTIIRHAPGASRRLAMCLYVCRAARESEALIQHPSMAIIHTNPPLPFPPIRGV